MPWRATEHSCHDPEIIEGAHRMGVRDSGRINRALSASEAPYRGIGWALRWLKRERTLLKLNQERQPKQRLSRRQKREILERHGHE